METSDIRTTNDIAYLKEQAENQTESVRIAVAGNPNTTSDILETLIHDKASLVRVVATQNKNCTENQLKEVSETDTDIAVLLGIASTTVYPEVLQILGVSKYENVRCNVAKNLHTTPEILNQLLNDSNLMVINTALCNPLIHEAQLRDILNKYKRNNAPVLDGITANPNCPKDLLRKFGTKSKNPSVLRNVAVNPNTEPDVLETLSKSLYAEVRKAVTYHINTPQKTMERLCKDKNESVRLSAERHLQKEKKGAKK